MTLLNTLPCVHAHHNSRWGGGAFQCFGLCVRGLLECEGPSYKKAHVIIGSSLVSAVNALARLISSEHIISALS
ncbi:hypothetical protein EON63_06805 [archaeon]|nr:MAG: hypothetical protein EON63_06805 [archaeon]